MPTGIYFRTKEYKDTLSLKFRGGGNPFWGKTHSEETRKIIREKRKNQIIGKRSEETRKKISIAQIGKKVSYETRIALSESHLGIIPSLETRKKRSETMKATIRQGLHPCWKGGIYPENRAIRKSLEYKIWRNAIFSRDDYRCFDCGERGLELHAHHIYPFSKYPRLRLLQENGITLCKNCHLKISPKR